MTTPAPFKGVRTMTAQEAKQRREQAAEDRLINLQVATLAGVDVTQHRWVECGSEDYCDNCGRFKWEDEHPCTGPNYLRDANLVLELLKDQDYEHRHNPDAAHPDYAHRVHLMDHGPNTGVAECGDSFCRAACLALIAANRTRE